MKETLQYNGGKKTTNLWWKDENQPFPPFVLLEIETYFMHILFGLVGLNI